MEKEIIKSIRHFQKVLKELELKTDEDAKIDGVDISANLLTLSYFRGQIDGMKRALKIVRKVK